MKSARQFLFIAAVAASANAAVAQTGSSASGPPSATSGTDSDASTVLAGDTLSKLGTVLSIDHERRDVVLRSDGGERLVVRLGEKVRNLASLKVGDRVSVTFGEAIAVAPAQSSANHLRLETTRTAQPAESERALIRKVERTAMIAEVVKVNGNSATLRSIGGETFVVSLEGMEHLPSMKEGSQIAVVHVETMALTEAPGGTGSGIAEGASAGSRAAAVESLGAASGAADSPSVKRLQKAAQRLREATQAMASGPAGEDRTQAIRRAQEALSQAQEAIALAASLNE